MKKLIAIVESPTGLVMGAEVDPGPAIVLPPEEWFPRSELKANAQILATRYGIDITGLIQPPKP